MAASIQELVKATDEQTTAVLALNQTIRTERNRRTFATVASLFGIALLIALIIGSWFIWRVAKDARAFGAENRRVLHILEDATTPGGEIYERGVGSTGKAICTLVTEQRKLHGINIPCDKPLSEKAETAPTNVYRGEDGFCVGMLEAEARRRGLTPDPTCVQN